jgi:hypothetical protein
MVGTNHRICIILQQIRVQVLFREACHAPDRALVILFLAVPKTTHHLRSWRVTLHMPNGISISI